MRKTKISQFEWPKQERGQSYGIMLEINERDGKADFLAGVHAR